MPVLDRSPTGVLGANGTGAVPFVIRRDTGKPLILVSMQGFWDVVTVDVYTAALDDAVREATAAGLPFGILIDCADYPVQSAETAQRFGEWYAAWPAPYRDDVYGIAIIAASVLNKMQAQRAFGSGVTIFLDRPSALRWLDERTPRQA